MSLRDDQRKFSLQFFRAGDLHAEGKHKGAWSEHLLPTILLELFARIVPARAVLALDTKLLLDDRRCIPSPDFQTVCQIRRKVCNHAPCLQDLPRCGLCQLCCSIEESSEGCRLTCRSSCSFLHPGPRRHRSRQASCRRCHRESLACPKRLCTEVLHQRS